ncbi:hypothetical protein NV379_07865 [Paenibacillus sp. N1-5-1-14]|uniref:hypothetical protein n=1 Tax=Paenibacillus radicibacter TaxID=2972488 RepID=UPI002158BDC8|nr:hypothetical protein [Paenibacillus radicibacter]MCR8642577.1 hypothetical protein [Paenibacillus radicibacter]
MLRYMKDGLVSTWKQPFIVITLFVYQLIWGVILYKLVYSIIVPMLHRFPDTDQGMTARSLFFAEGQFQIFKTDLPQAYLWSLGTLLAARMVIHPIINAGVYYSLANKQLNSGYRFVAGIKELTGPFLLYYIIQVVFTLSPLFWLYSKATYFYSHASSYNGLIQGMLPWIGGYLLYCYLINLVFMYIQFGRIHNIKAFSSILSWLKHSPKVIGLSLVLLIITCIMAAAAMTTSYIWAGLIALILYQAYPIIEMFLKVWSIAAQYELWSSKNITY